MKDMSVLNLELKSRLGCLAPFIFGLTTKLHQALVSRLSVLLQSLLHQNLTLQTPSQLSTMNQSNVNQPSTIRVPTVQAAPRVIEIDTSALTDEELTALKKSDPFMYYSIPGVINAFRTGQPVNHSNLVADASRDAADAAAGGRNATVVSRRTRISDGCDLLTSLSAELNSLGDW
jgi:hypothetical protein